MPTRLKGTAFGPGFASTGSAVEFDISDYGLTLVTEESFDGTPPWQDVTQRKQDYSGLMLEWPGSKGHYALSVSDPAAVQAIKALRGQSAPARHKGQDRATRAWLHGALWLTVVGPVLAIALLLWQHERIAVWAVDRIPVEQERQLGETVFAQTKAKLKLVEGAPQQLVRDIGARLTQGSAYQYEFYVADDPTVNAFAMPGGFIVVHTGLLKLAATPEEVAGVLAHEVRHVESRHSLRAMAQSAGLKITLMLVFGDVGGLAGMAGDLLGLKFSREHESQADSEGLQALVKANIRPQGMRDFFRKMADQEKLNIGWFSSHPASAERFAAMDARLKQLPAAALEAPALSFDYEAVKAALKK